DGVLAGLGVRRGDRKEARGSDGKRGKSQRRAHGSSLPDSVRGAWPLYNPSVGETSTQLGRRERPCAERGVGDGLALRGDLDVLHLRPALGEGAIVGRERISRLTRGLDVERAVQIRKIVDRPVARGATAGEWRLLAELDLAAVERVGVARARHLDIEEGGDTGHQTEGAMLSRGEVCCTP